MKISLSSILVFLFMAQFAFSQSIESKFAYDLGIAYPITLSGSKANFDHQINMGIEFINESKNGIQLLGSFRGVAANDYLIFYGLKGRYFYSLNNGKRIYGGIGSSLIGNNQQGLGQFSAEVGLVLKNKFVFHICYNEITQARRNNNKTISLGLNVQENKAGIIVASVGTIGALVGFIVYNIIRGSR